jgi:hypothetical protein
MNLYHVSLNASLRQVEAENATEAANTPYIKRLIDELEKHGWMVSCSAHNEPPKERDSEKRPPVYKASSLVGQWGGLTEKQFQNAEFVYFEHEDGHATVLKRRGGHGHGREISAAYLARILQSYESWQKLTR